MSSQDLLQSCTVAVCDIDAGKQALLERLQPNPTLLPVQRKRDLTFFIAVGCNLNGKRPFKPKLLIKSYFKPSVIPMPQDSPKKEMVMKWLPNLHFQRRSSDKSKAAIIDNASGMINCHWSK